MTEETDNKGYKMTIAILVAIGVLFVSGVLILWSWNTFAVDLFQAPKMQFRHALAIELLAASIAAIFGLTLRLSSGHTRHHAP